MTNVKITTRLPLQVKRKRGRPFEKGNPGGPGRPVGSHDRMTRELKAALLTAVERVGEKYAEAAAAKRKAEGLAPERAALRGISAYLENVAENHPQVMCALLSKIMPQQQQTEVKVEHRYQTMEEIANRLRELGLQPQRIYPLIEAKKPEPGEVN
jgi:hypothetical protein